MRPRAALLVLSASLVLALALVDRGAAQQSARVLPRDVLGAADETATEFLLPELGITVFDLRRALPDGGIERVGLDADGRVVDVDALRRADRELALERHGRMHPGLIAALSALAPGERIEVAFWLRSPDDGVDLLRLVAGSAAGLPRGAIGPTVRSARAAALELNRERLAPASAAVAQAVLAAGGELLSSDLGWPVVVAALEARAVPAVASSAWVDLAYPSQPEWFDEGNFAQGTMRTYNVHDQGVLADGSVRVMVNDTSAVEFGHPFLPPVVALVGGGAASHATGVAGNIANVHPTYYAAASGLPVIYSAPGNGDAVAPGVWQAAIASGIDLGNISWWNAQKGQIQFLDRFFDYTIRNFSVMLFKSNGNQGGTSLPACTTPGCGYNMISSGNYSDQNTLDWAGDAMAGSSSFSNPVEGHEKPELASPGECVATTSTGGGIQSCFGGTSSASPLTCGVAALLCSADNGLLAEMTTLKAALMVSAWHNVEGAALLSDKDGAGGVHAKAAHALIRDQQWWHQMITPADFTGSFLDVPIPLLAGEETRVIALWFSRADSAFTSDSLALDLDLRVLDPAGFPVAFAGSAVNPFELATFTAPVSGTYTARLVRQKFLSASEPLTVAWSTRNDAGTAEIVPHPATPPFAVGGAPRFVLRERYTGAGKSYLGWASVSPAPGLALGGGWTLPIGYDFVSQVVLGAPGFAGVLPAGGSVSPSIAIPPSPGLAGIDVHFALAVLDPAAPGGVGQLSDPLVLAILP